VSATPRAAKRKIASDKRIVNGVDNRLTTPAEANVSRVKPALNTVTRPASSGSGARVGYLVYRLERRLRDRLDDAVRAHGVTTTEYVTLSVLRTHDGMSCAQLARWAFVTPQAMNVVITALEKRRLVRRRQDPQHGRVLRTSVTRKGLEVLDRCDRAMDVIEADMLGQMSPESVENLKHLLAECAHALEATKPRLAF
jgi:DNA-binding MarR family transcriptional regulator